jgi:hypothetical protein
MTVDTKHGYLSLELDSHPPTSDVLYCVLLFPYTVWTQDSDNDRKFTTGP